jgi:hypothetical protein
MSGIKIMAIAIAISCRVFLPRLAPSDFAAKRASMGKRQAKKTAAWFRFAKRPTALPLLVI